MRGRVLRRIGLLLAIAVGILADVAAARAEFPDKPITLIVPWTRSSGSDLTARTLARLLSADLGQPVNVSNVTGGSGVAGHKAIAEAAPDGYTIGVVTVELSTLHWPGLTNLTYADFTLLGQVSADPAVILVRPDAKSRSLGALVAAIRAAPVSTFRTTGTGQGGIWHLAFAGFLKAAGVPFHAVPWTPSQGSIPALEDLDLDVVDIVVASASEARSAIAGGRAVPLGVLARNRHPLLPEVPTAKEAAGLDWAAGAWRGVAGPKGLPPAVADRLGQALKAAVDSQAFADFLRNLGQERLWRDGPAFEAFLAGDDAAFGTLLKALGLIQ